jgi:hypothetical protein
MPFVAYLRLMSADAFVATVVLVLGADGWISPEQFQTLYSPAVWACLKLPFFTLEHERWIEVVALGRIIARAFWTGESD